MMALRGTVFQLQGDNFHYWVVMAVADGKALVFNLTDARHLPGCPCVFVKGEHPLIVKDTAVNYRKAREFSAERISQEVALGSSVRAVGVFPDALIARMVTGALQSDDLTKRFLDYFA